MRTAGRSSIRPTTMAMAPNTAPTSPRTTPARPRARFMGLVFVAVFGVDDAVLVLGLVLLGVLHEDAVAGEHQRIACAADEVALEHDGLAGLEEVGRVTGVLDGDVVAVEGDREA